jgi:hypothetical protein
MLDTVTYDSDNPETLAPHVVCSECQEAAATNELRLRLIAQIANGFIEDRDLEQIRRLIDHLFGANKDPQTHSGRVLLAHAAATEEDQATYGRRVRPTDPRRDLTTGHPGPRTRPPRRPRKCKTPAEQPLDPAGACFLIARTGVPNHA